MANSLVSIKGLKELDAMLKQLPANIERNVLRGGLRAGIKVFKDSAVELLPADYTALIKSLKIKTSGRNGIAMAKLIAGNKDAYYAHWLEYGTASYYTGTGRTVGAPYAIRPRRSKVLADNGKYSAMVIHPGIKPLFFMRRSFDQHYEQAISAMRTYMTVRIEKELVKARVTL